MYETFRLRNYINVLQLTVVDIGAVSPVSPFQDYYILFLISTMSRLRGNGRTKDTLNIKEATNDDNC